MGVDLILYVGGKGTSCDVAFSTKANCPLTIDNYFISALLQEVAFTLHKNLLRQVLKCV